MTTSTPAPNEDTPRVPSDPSTGRNDPAIDPDGQAPAGGGATPNTDQRPAQGEGKEGDDEKAQANEYSPDFAPEPDRSKPGVAKDADIDTDGG